ncbi:MAG: diguanylate cyclase [Synergistaceae bacterium]|nr:diguanylate cyclase [Synergistaceae bacterium]
MNKKIYSFSHLNKIGLKMFFGLAFLFFIIFGANNIYGTWKGSLAREQNYAFILAESIGAFIPSEYLSETANTKDPTHDEEYIYLKKQLLNIPRSLSQISSVYVLCKKGEQIYYLADSGDPQAPGQTIPRDRSGEFYTSGPANFVSRLFSKKTFDQEKSIFRHGGLTSIFVPLKKYSSDDTAAVIGIDYYTKALMAETIKKVFASAMIFLVLVIFLIAGYMIISKKLCIRLACKKINENNDNKFLISNITWMSYRCLFDNDKTWTMLSVSENCSELTGYTPQDFIKGKISFSDIIEKEDRETLLFECERSLALHVPFRNQYRIITACGTQKWVLITGHGVYATDGSVDAVEGIIIDTSGIKINEEKIQYVNDYDHLTNLYNRQYFEKALSEFDRKEHLPLSVLLADINGLHLINEAFGESDGNLLIIKSAEIIKNYCRKKDIPARIDGDEFGIIMPQTDNEEACNFLDNIKNACTAYNKNNSDRSPKINISMGCSTKNDEDESIENTLIKANEYMRNRKFFSQQSSYSETLSFIMTAICEKSPETGKHAERLVELATRVGRKMNLMENDIGELQLLAILHDIGKVGIDDKILNKPGKLTAEEWRVMKKHPEIGYRIAKASSKLTRIADYILCHHERWDGKGYPKGLKGENIPLLSRILSVADAYDAMTEDRIYRKAMSKNDAIEEIRRNAGSQFNPTVANIFIESVA